jgi:hypothetical protein
LNYFLLSRFSLILQGLQGMIFFAVLAFLRSFLAAGKVKARAQGMINGEFNGSE